MVTMHLGALFLHARKSQNQTQAESAASLGVCRQTIAAWERGEIPEDALDLVCGYIGEAIANHQFAAASARAESELLKRRWAVMVLQVRAAVGV
jgi:transcriptional regulator with XRE-family HTH domain